MNIVKSVTGKNLVNKLPLSVCRNGTLTENQQVIADYFQSHFLYIADKLVSNNIEDIKDINCKDYLNRIFKTPYPNLIFDHTMTKEIENIIKSRGSNTTSIEQPRNTDNNPRYATTNDI
jgi:hypothetical protein